MSPEDRRTSTATRQSRKSLPLELAAGIPRVLLTEAGSGGRADAALLRGQRSRRTRPPICPASSA